jgi:predicted enzyme related to lactoylglutathione lyase
MANQIVWFDIPVLDIDRAIAFYSAVLGNPATRQDYPGMSMALLPGKDPDVTGCMYKDDHIKPSDNGPLLYFNCNDRLTEAVKAAESQGGKVVMPKHQIGPYGYRAIVLDSEGNRIALHSHGDS